MIIDQALSHIRLDTVERIRFSGRPNARLVFARQIRPDRLTVTTNVAGDLRDRPTPLRQCINLHVLAPVSTSGRAPLLASRSLLAASLERTPPDDGYLSGGGEFQ